MILFIILSVFEGYGQSINATGIGGNEVAFHMSELQSNQAALSYRDGINFAYIYNREYSLLETHVANFSWNNIGIALKSRQTPDPNSSSALSTEMEAQLGHGISLTDNLRIGYSFNAYYLSIQDYGNAMTGGFDVSILGEIYDDWLVGVNAHNINRPRIGDEIAYELPWSMSAGLSYNPYPDVVTHLAFTRDRDNPLRIHFGQIFSISEQFTIKAGIQNEPVRLSMGIELKTKWLSFMYSVRNHERLSLSHWVGVSYR